MSSLWGTSRLDIARIHDHLHGLLGSNRQLQRARTKFQPQRRCDPVQDGLRLKGLEAIFDSYLRRSTENPALMGASMLDANGIERTVYLRLMAGIWDYPEAAASTMTLQNSTCYVCRRMAGEFQWYHPHDRLRTVASETQKVREAWAAHPQSASARAAFCRPYGLQPEHNPYHFFPGMDGGFGVYSGSAFARLHNVYEGTLHPCKSESLVR
jgi:hypothetical protein